MIGRLVRAADFERVLRTRARARTEHFAIHHLAGWPSRPVPVSRQPVSTKLSTDGAPGSDQPVDDSLVPASRRWLGMVVPKRYARRAVTRTLIKRRMRAACDACEHQLESGLWVLRLRGPFDPKVFVSAASDALRARAAAELDDLLRAALQCRAAA